MLNIIKSITTLNVDIHLNEEAKDINSYDYAITAVGAIQYGNANSP